MNLIVTYKNTNTPKLTISKDKRCEIKLSDNDKDEESRYINLAKRIYGGVYSEDMLTYRGNFIKDQYGFLTINIGNGKHRNYNIIKFTEKD